jgi:septum formation protein
MISASDILADTTMNEDLKIVLASSSPRRKRLMEQLGLGFVVVEPGPIVEVNSKVPEEAVLANALAKAKGVAKRQRDAIVISADTVVVVGGEVLGKPAGASEAQEMLTFLQGRAHRVMTALVIVHAASGTMESDVVETRVRMLPMTSEEIRAYVETGEPMDKAGGYAIQGLGAVLVEEIEGCYYNVVGLPISRLAQLLKRFGVIIP